MKSSNTIAYLALGSIGLGSFLLPRTLTVQTAVSQSQPSTIRILGVVRDFKVTHPDFNVPASTWEVSGNVALKLGERNVPVSESIISSHGSNGASTVVDTISKWAFDESSGTTATDNRGVQDGTLINGAARAKGRFGKAVRFDGIDDHVHVPHDPAYLVDVSSLAFWFNAEDTTTRQVLIGKDASGFGDGGHLTCFLENGQVRVRLESASASYVVESVPGSVIPDTWHHVAFSFGPGGMLLYLDSESANSNPYGGGLGTSSGGSGNTEPWTFGVGRWQGGGLPGGALDEFNAVSYAGSDGSQPWSGSWVEANDDASASTGKARVEAGHLYVDNSDWGTGASLTRGVDLSGATSATLTFDFGGYGTGPVDIFAVEASDNGGTTYVLMESVPVIENASDSRSYNLQDFISLTSDVVIRFRQVQGFQASGQHFTIDNVSVGETVDWSDPFRGMIDEVQVFTRSLDNADFMSVGGFLVDMTQKDSSNRPVAPHLTEDDAAPCFTAGDTPPVVGVTTDGAISSRASFSEWFQDVPGTNVAGAHAITLTNDGTGVYEYLTDDFYPADDRLFGNEGDVHNQYSTYSFTSTFTYSQCMGEFLEFEGGDGAWMFIDEDLAIDLGGAGVSSAQYVEMDRLGLVDGQTYTLRFFYAQRRSGDAVFRLRTNLLLSGSDRVVISGAFD